MFENYTEEEIKKRIHILCEEVESSEDDIRWWNQEIRTLEAELDKRRET